MRAHQPLVSGRPPAVTRSAQARRGARSPRRPLTGALRLKLAAPSAVTGRQRQRPASPPCPGRGAEAQQPPGAVRSVSWRLQAVGRGSDGPVGRPRERAEGPPEMEGVQLSIPVTPLPLAELNSQFLASNSFKRLRQLIRGSFTNDAFHYRYTLPTSEGSG